MPKVLCSPNFFNIRIMEMWIAFWQEATRGNSATVSPVWKIWLLLSCGILWHSFRERNRPRWGPSATALWSRGWIKHIEGGDPAPLAGPRGARVEFSTNSGLLSTRKTRHHWRGTVEATKMRSGAPLVRRDCGSWVFLFRTRLRGYH